MSRLSSRGSRPGGHGGKKSFSDTSHLTDPPFSVTRTTCTCVHKLTWHPQSLCLTNCGVRQQSTSFHDIMRGSQVWPSAWMKHSTAAKADAGKHKGPSGAAARSLMTSSDISHTRSSSIRRPTRMPYAELPAAAIQSTALPKRTHRAYAPAPQTRLTLTHVVFRGTHMLRTHSKQKVLGAEPSRGDPSRSSSRFAVVLECSMALISSQKNTVPIYSVLHGVPLYFTK